MSAEYRTKWLTPDLLKAGAISLPQSLSMQAGTVIDITFPDGRTGRLTVTDLPPQPDRFRAYWNCSGSAYDGRAFDLVPGTLSDGFQKGQPIMVPMTMILVAEKKRS